VTIIPQKELRNNVGEVLRRAEAGEEFTVTVSGRPVARLGPARPRQWVSGAALERIWHTPAPETLADDLATFPAELVDGAAH
jgi:prevent-host-death family protein